MVRLGEKNYCSYFDGEKGILFREQSVGISTKAVGSVSDTAAFECVEGEVGLEVFHGALVTRVDSLDGEGAFYDSLLGLTRVQCFSLTT